MTLTNYHTHTYRCFHAAQVPDEEYIENAIKSGFEILGFSDHTPWPYTSGYVSKNERMPLDGLEEYLSSMRALKEKYAGKIERKIGLECEYFPKFYDWLRETAPKLDYLILGNHFGLSDEHGEKYYGTAEGEGVIEEYTSYTLAGMGTGLFDCLAHPELPFANHMVFDEEARMCARMICREAKAIGMPLEYNLYGTVKQDLGRQKGLGYPAKEFWQVAAEFGCDAIIGIDAHKPEHLLDMERFMRARNFLESLGLHVIEELPMKR